MQTSINQTNNMIPKYIIELAIKGGWKSGFFAGQAIAKCGDTIIPAMWQVYALDPLFWRSIGRELEWEGEKIIDNLEDAWMNPEWYDKANEFFALIMSGGDTSAYWKQITDKRV